jgi:hypothetical protein
MFLPAPRGPLSAGLVRALRSGGASSVSVPAALPPDPIADDDLQLALWIGYELHYRGFADVDDDREWDPHLLAFRRSLESAMLNAVRAEVPPLPPEGIVPDRLRRLVEQDDGPQLSSFLQRSATAAQFSEFLIHRSIYQLKEADPHTWVIPRLSGRAKAALVELQFDEYGGGRPTRMHSELYRKLLRRTGLSDEYGYYVDAVPGITLAVSNVMSALGLNRTMRGAIVGHLAAYEMTSSIPCRRYGKGLRRLGGDDDSCEFFDEHVTADAAHEQVAMYDLCGALAKDEPELADSILFGAAACLSVDARFAAAVLDAWQHGRSSLRDNGAEQAAPGRLAG